MYQGTAESHTMASCHSAGDESRMKNDEVHFNVLVVDDSPTDAKLIESMLAPSAGTRFCVEHVSTLDDALARLACGGIDVVILDLSLRESSGISTFDKTHSAAHDVPIVVVSGLGEEEVAVESLKRGAQDYLVKDQLSPDLLHRALRYAMERHRLYKTLRSSEERFHQLTDNMREVFWLLDLANWKLLYVSPAYEQIWGRDRSELYESFDGWVDAIHPHDRDRVERHLRGEIQQDGFHEQYRIARPDGSSRWIGDRGVPIRDADGKIYRVAGIAEDITEQRKLEREVIEASAREQHRIGRDLHDSVGQVLTGLGYMARSLARKLTESGAPETGLAEEIVAATQQALLEVRHAIRGLRPVELDAHGLMVALEQLAQSVQQRMNIPCHFQCDRPAPVEDNEAATQLYRIAQESINNAAKHAKPNSILVRLESEDDGVLLQICDDGLGMMDAGDENFGMGLRTMRYRANAIGANFTITSKKDIGTVVECILKRDDLHDDK